MKLLTLAAAGATLLTGIVAVAPADAQRVVVHERTVVHHDRHWGRTRTVCNWQWRNHHRVRVCRTVRY